MKKLIITTALVSALTAISANAAEQDLPSREEMWKMIQAQQQQISSLEKMVKKTDEKVEATSVVVEQVASQPASANVATHGWWDKTSIGGYGEIHLNKGSTKDEIDSHRLVLFVGHEFSDDIRFVSEIEFEHTNETFVEQAFLEFDLNESNQAKAGVVLIPVGILNETHEPTTFFGVERNVIETNVIPSTWYEGGVMFSGELGDGFGYDIAYHSGLDANNAAGYNIRNSRDKVSFAAAESGAATGRVKYTGIPGLRLAATVQYQQDISQNVDTTEADATLFETNADYRTGGWGLRALYAQWDINGAGAAASGQDEQYGYYIEPSYTFDITDSHRLGFFGRYNAFDIIAGDNVDSERKQYDVGLNYWPHENVVLKADMAFLDAPVGGIDDEIFNLGVGFTF